MMHSLVFRKLILFLVCIFITAAVCAQGKPITDTTSAQTIVVESAVPSSDYLNIPDLLPASPEAMAFVKSGVGNVNLSTGAVAAKLPLYDIKIKDFSFPIYLSYSTQGLKTDEASSRVGLGWVLNANAVITRSVRGEPDEFSQRLAAPPDLSANTQAVFDYLYNATLPVGSGNDTQPDEFQFNVNGYSGKFVLDNNYVPRVTATANVVISAPISPTPGSTSGTIGPITIITPDGVKYSFTIYEKTTAINMKRYSPYFNTTITAFYLSRIDLPTGEYITYQYSPISTTVATGKADQLVVIGGVSGSGNCTSCATNSTQYTTNTDRISYNSYYLTNITTSTGIVVNLSYQARPDLSQDNRLTTLEVVGLKKYSFEYYNLPNQSTITTGRYFLTKVKDSVITGRSGDAGQDYSMVYNSMTSVPLPISAGQDQLGFYNGSSNTNLLPNYVNSQGIPDLSNRNPNPNFSIYGTLASITYPTGGKEEYFYESNTRTTQSLRNTKVNINVGGLGAQVYSSGMLYCPVNQTIQIRTSAYDADLNDGHTAGVNEPTVIMRLYDGITQIASRSSLGYAEDIYSYNLLADHTYRLEVQVKNTTESGSSSFSLDTSPVPIYDNVDINMPGLRVARIKYTDPINANNHSRYFKYASLGNLNTSSGSFWMPTFNSVANDRTYCGGLNQFYTNCAKTVYSSSSTQSVYEMAGSGSVIYYTNIIESNSPNFLYGGTEHIFFSNDDGSNFAIIIGNGNPFLAGGQTPGQSGMEWKTRVFNSDLSIVSEDENIYETRIDLSTATYSYYYRKQFESSFGWPDWKDAFDGVKMTYGNYWIRLKNKISRSYVPGNQMTTQTSYIYGTSVNILPDSVIVQDSKGGNLITTYKYPTSSFTGDPDALIGATGYPQLVTKNNIIPVIQQTQFRNTVLMQKTRTLYKDWFSNGTIITPKVIQQKKSPTDTLVDVIVFGKYDTRGNVLEVKKNGDVQNTYIWDKEKSLVTAKIIGDSAVFDKSAYTGFEIAADYGNWTYVSGAVNSAASYTGVNSFTGSLSKTLTGTGIYTVSLWTNSSATVNGAAGTLMRTVRGWNLYNWSLTNPATITVSGTNIDELRLLLSNARMTTLTHKPFIGLSARLDENQMANYFDYDYRNRLSITKDENLLIGKKYDYSFAGVVSPATTYGNDEVSGYFSKNNCTGGTSGSAVLYIIPAGTYTSSISQADANQQATNALNSGGVANANLKGSCTVPQCSYCLGADKKCIGGVCESGGFIYTSSVYQQVSIAGALQWRYVVTAKYCFSDGSTSTYSWQEARTTSPTLNTCYLP